MTFRTDNSNGRVSAMGLWKYIGQAVACIVFAALCTGCATIISGRTQDVGFNSVPSGADVKLNDGAQMVTPGKLTLKRSERYTATFTKEGFPERQTEVKHD